jgi:hypothetical protein
MARHMAAERVCAQWPNVSGNGAPHRPLRLGRAGEAQVDVIEITACCMGRMPQAVAPLTVRKGSGPSPSFAPAVAPMRLASLTHPLR